MSSFRSILVLLLACVFAQASEQQTISKEEILKIFEEINKEQNGSVAQTGDLPQIPELSEEEIRKKSKKEALVSMTDEMIKSNAPSVIYVPVSNFSSIGIGEQKIFYVSANYIDEQIEMNQSQHERRKEDFKRKLKAKNIEATEENLRALETEIFQQNMSTGGYYAQSAVQNMNTSSGTTAINDLLELQEGTIYKNYVVSITKEQIVLTHLEEINNVK